MDTIFKYLPLHISRLLAQKSDRFLDSITEIRLRRSKAFSVSVGNKNYFFSASGSFCTIGSGIICTDEDISYTIEKLCASSMYSFEDTIKNGYIPLENGCRAGVCGECVTTCQNVSSVRRINSINIRVSRFKKDFALALCKHYISNDLTDTLIISPPAFGKTTFLKSLAALLSEGAIGRALKVGVVDERCELYEGISSVGILDVICGCPKAYGIMLMTRTMSPDVIICDEISPTEANEIQNARNCGVKLICSLHAGNISEALSRPFVMEMVSNGGFETYVLLKEGYKYDVCQANVFKYETKV